MFRFVETVGIMDSTRDHVRQQIGQRLAAAIRRAGVSQRQLADQLGFASATLNRWVKGANQPPLEVLVELCGLLGVSTDEVLGLAQGQREVNTARLNARIDRLEARVRTELARELAALRAEVERLRE